MKRHSSQSSLPNERRQAVDWLVWVDSVSRQDSKRRGFADGMPVLPDSAIRSLFTAAVQDENAAIGDEAFEYREMSEQERGQPGECYTIIPALRKTLRTPSAETEHLTRGISFELCGRLRFHPGKYWPAMNCMAGNRSMIASAGSN